MPGVGSRVEQRLEAEHRETVDGSERDMVEETQVGQTALIAIDVRLLLSIEPMASRYAKRPFN